MDPFDPIERSKEVELIVMSGNARRYYRFRFAKFYGGIATADAMGCNILCAYCWNYSRNLHPGTGEFHSPTEVAQKLNDIAKKHNCDQFRLSGSEPFLGEISAKHLVEVIKATSDGHFVMETNGIFLGYDSKLAEMLKGLNLTVRVTLKGNNPETFQKVTGANGDAFQYQLDAIKNLRLNRIRCGVAVMTDFVDFKRLQGSMPYISFEREHLIKYSGTEKRLKERGLYEK